MPGQEARPKAIGDWLQDIGLSHYADVFAQNRVDLDVLADLTEADLIGLGIPLGDRKRLLHAIGSLVDAKAVRGQSGTRQTTIGLSNATTAERRQLTVMFCDMVGSTALARQFDPEEVREIIAAYRETCACVIERYDGYIARYVGDGILVYFGYPKAHEDDAERAVRAGLEIVQTIATQSKETPTSNSAAVRIGIATGIVVVGDMVSDRTKEQDSVVGETPNLAARLQTLASPNSVIIAPSTRSLLRAGFEFEELGDVALKGVPESTKASRVVRLNASQNRFAGKAGLRFTPLVNREEEIALLLMRWRQAKEGDGQVVLLSGEPGIGKSRITQEIRHRIDIEPHEQITFQSFPYYTNTPFHPFVQHLKSVSGMDHESAIEVPLQRLEATVTSAFGTFEEIAPL